MASHIGVLDLRGLTVPEGGFAHESTKKSDRPIVETKNNLGVTVFMDQMPHEEQTLGIKGTGVADFSILAAASSAPGAVQITGVTADHELGKRPTFEIEARKFVNDA